jgi:hypothetical protein
VDKSIGNRNGCPYCWGRKANNKNNLLIKNPLLCKEWNYSKNGNLVPENIPFGSHKLVWWKCQKGHEWKAEIKARRNGNGCPYCSNRIIDVNNCLAKLNPRLAQEWHPTKNGTITPFDVGEYTTGKKIWWKCKKGHEWESDLSHRSIGRGCPFCGKIALNDGTLFDSLPEAYLYLKLTARGFRIELKKKYGFSPKSKCDFYLPAQNTYIETTSYHKNATGWAKTIWKSYFAKIQKKKKYVEKVLGANFRFIQIHMNDSRILYVRRFQK